MGVCAGGDKDDGCVAGEFVQDVGHIHVFVLGRNEKVLLKQCPDGAIFGGDLHLKRGGEENGEE